MSNEEIKKLIGDEGKNVMETAAPQTWVTSVGEQLTIKVDNEQFPITWQVIFTALGNYFRATKSKETPITFKFENVAGDSILQARVEWIPDGEDNGNWNYSVSFDEIEEKGDKVMNFNDISVHPFFSDAWGKIYHALIKRVEWFNCITLTAIEVLHQWLLDNTKDDSKAVAYVNNVFVASAELNKDGKIDTAIELFGEYKALIKNDDNDSIVE